MRLHETVNKCVHHKTGGNLRLHETESEPACTAIAVHSGCDCLQAMEAF